MPRSAASAEATIADGPADIVISDRRVLAEGFRPYERIAFTSADERGTPQIRDVLRAGAGVAVLPLDLARDEIVLLRQFRLAAHLAGGKGNLVEIVAGHVEASETRRETARRECIEEIGVAPSRLVELFSYFTTPGMCDEEITLFLGIVDAARVPERAGAATEHEQTQVMRASVDAALAALAAGTVHNGPLVIALQWLALNRARLREIAGSASP